jgi:predicted acyl esterase
VVLAAVAFVVVHLRGRGTGTALGSDVSASIPTSDGVQLSAQVISPGGSGPFPLLVMPASWNSPAQEYRTVGSAFAAAGVQVVAYAQRGFRGSGGEADLGGARTQKDVSDVIDWALKHTHADPNRIGLFGVSYGGGVSLLAAARDSRIKAVVATSTWTDLGAALAPHGTPNIAGLGWIFDAPDAADHLTPQLQQLNNDRKNDPAAAAALLAEMSKTRSADRVVSAINRNGPAIMLANAFNDSLLDPTSLVSFFDKLHTPKRLQLAPGDHGGPELPGLFGRPDPTVKTAAKWIDHYLNGTDNGIQRGGPVVLLDGATGASHSYKSWPAAQTTLQLGTPGSADSLAADASATWSSPLTTGTESGASIGTQRIESTDTYQPTTISIGSVQQAHALMWNAPAVSSPMRVDGTPLLRLHVAASTPSVSLFAYLYDVNGSGLATLVTYAPTTVSAGDVSVTMRPLSWTVRAGHHLALVVDTADPNFAAAEPAGATATLSSPGSLSVAAG